MTFSPIDISDLLVWLRADYLSLSDGDVVATWPDLSGNSNNAVQSTLAKRPTFKTAIHNSLPVVRFATDDWMKIPVLMGDTADGGMTVFVISKSSNDTLGAILSTRSAEDLPFEGFTFRYSNNTSCVYFHTSIGGVGLAVTDKFNLIEITKDGLDVNIGKNGTIGVPVTLPSFLPTVNTDGTYIGTEREGLTSLFTGDIGEIVCYDRYLTENERQQVEQYLLRKWAIYDGPEEIIPNYPPASKIRLQFRAGDSDQLPMGIFYADRMQYEVGGESVSIEARNSIGKYLKDQTFDERNVYTPTTVQALLTQILTGAGITNYHVGTETTQLGMEFSPSQDILSGIDDVLTTVRDWQIREEIAAGKVVVAERTDEAFTQPGKYTFYRNRDVFSRSVTKDDGQTYGRVCVHTSDFSVKVYRPVSSSLGWLPPAQKTLYQQCPDGTTSMQVAALATEIAEQLSNSGEVEEFVGPIRPQLMPGDSAEIIDNDGPRLVGIITTVIHNFGQDGFYTQFTVDSGGKINKPLLSDYLKQISAGTVKSKITS